MADFNSLYSCPSIYDDTADYLLELQLWQFSDQSAIERMTTLTDIVPGLQNQVAVPGSNSHGADLHMDMPPPSDPSFIANYTDFPPSDPSFMANYTDFQTLNPISFSNHDDVYQDNAIFPALDYVQTTGCEGLLESKNTAIAMIVPPERTQDEEAKTGIAENQLRNNASLVVNDHSKEVLAAANPPTDGHNWRKYGQKQVKKSKFPRSYYRCTHPNCKVTKKIEYSAQGHVSEIIYKGSHDHPKANPSCDHVRKFLMQQMAVGKRWIATAEMSSSARSACQPKYKIVIESHLEVFDDGFRWRKYGQKVVKGNSNPRSYYKCTHPECLVRKHIERSPNDSKLLLTTYEGHHEHEIPATREHMSNNSRMANREGFVGFKYPKPLDMVPSGTISVKQPASATYEGHHGHEIHATREHMSNNMALEARAEAPIMANLEGFVGGFEYPKPLNLVPPGTISVEQPASATYEGHHGHEIHATREHMSNNMALEARAEAPIMANLEGFVGGFEYPKPLNLVPPGTISVEQPASATYEGHHGHEIHATREHMSNNMALEARVEASIMANLEELVGGFEYPKPLNMVPPGTISVEQPASATYEGHHEHEIHATREHMSNNMALEARAEAPIMANLEGFVGFEYPNPLDMIPSGMISVEQLAAANVCFGSAIMPPLDSRMGMAIMPKVECTPELGVSSSTAAQLPLQANVPDL